MYLSEESKSVEIVSSKSSEMNVLLPKGNGDYVSFVVIILIIYYTPKHILIIFFVFIYKSHLQTELPIPEQYKTTVQGNSIITTCVESLG